MKRDLAGLRFGKLTAVEPTSERKHNAVVWRCRCDCGNEILVESRRLKPGVIYSCGCQAPPAAGGDLTGLRFGRLTVCGATEKRSTNRYILWRCQCDCGNLVEVGRDKLLSGGTTSCGCGQKPQRKDYLGKRFGMLTVTGYAGKKGGVHYWRCRCDCGNLAEVSQSNLQSGQVSCGCIQSQRPGLHFVDGTFVEGIQSQTRSKANRSGVRGVYFNKKRGKWIAQIMFKGKCYYLGGYAQIEEAAKARRRAEEETFGNFLQWYQEVYGDASKKELV